ncbi:3-hydroxyisobutyrate dehydrogenase [Actinokineospora baliensis]|uniref:NAD(P)-dependent oxidoreductase n=1 Tax=Actinokineospora baliensis TaxID=547056 RepID=UPI00195F1ECB|nr:NAD(P)-dependent oxidoreductase [Actinokineospora baliensis]MBM7775019.1 3-hydroxyisobutyrate dehydrogenase [Actinokineospora baliensis]
MSSTRPTVAVLGTGTIGAPVARNLAKTGFEVRVWNRTREKADELVPDGVVVAASPNAAVKGADIVLTVLKDGQAVRETMAVAAPELGADAVWAQLSTVGEDIDDLAAWAAERGISFVDAPVQGTRQPAEQGQLVVLAAGPEPARAALAPVFDTIGRKTVWVAAEAGAASRLKLVLNTWVIALTSGVAEAMALAEGIGVDPAHFVDVVSGGPMDNGYFQGKSAAIRSGDFTPAFTVDNAEKDARLVLAAAERAGVRLDAVRAGADRFARASALGHGGQDMAATYFASFE